MKFKIIPNEQTPKVNSCKQGEILLENDRQILIKFLSFARRQINCAGLAANQVSLDGERIMEKFFAIKIDHFWDIIVHPIILKEVGKKKEFKEGCLTWLGKTIYAKRYSEIEVSYYNLKGELQNRVISGFEAQVWQHEYNHLIGVEEDVR